LQTTKTQKKTEKHEELESSSSNVHDTTCLLLWRFLPVIDTSGFYSDPLGESARWWSTKTWIYGCFFQFESFNSFPESCLGFAWFLSQPRFGHSYSWGFT
jgi:hypothetical protein